MKEGAEPGKLRTLCSTGIGRAMAEAQMTDAGSRSSGSGSLGGLDAVRWRFSMQIVTRRDCVFWVLSDFELQSGYQHPLFDAG